MRSCLGTTLMNFFDPLQMLTTVVPGHNIVPGSINMFQDKILRTGLFTFVRTMGCFLCKSVWEAVLESVSDLNRYLAVSEKSSGHTQQLSLSHWEVLSVIRHLWMKWIGQLAYLKINQHVTKAQLLQSQHEVRLWKIKPKPSALTHHVLNVCFLQSFPDLCICILIPGIQIWSVGETSNLVNMIWP